MKYGSLGRKLLLSTALLFAQFSQANIVINGTRVIYNDSDREIAVKLTNNGLSPALAQSWIDDGDANAKPEQLHVPFTITPPINRIDADKSQTLRISFTGEKALSQDRETLYWLNVLDIPAAKNDNTQNKLQLAYRTRIKLFYRPSSLAGGDKSAKAAEELKWTVSDGQVNAKNMSPYYVSLISVAIKSDSVSASVQGEMLAPGEEKQFKFKTNDLIKPGAVINYQYINDWGAIKKFSQPI